MFLPPFPLQFSAKILLNFKPISRLFHQKLHNLAMLDWEIEDQKLFLLFLIERNRPFPPNDENSANMDFNKDVYTLMGTGQNVPNKTKDNIGNLYQNLKVSKKQV